MSHADMLLHSNISPVWNLYDSFQVCDSQKRWVVLIMNSQLSLKKKFNNLRYRDHGEIKRREKRLPQKQNVPNTESVFPSVENLCYNFSRFSFISFYGCRYYFFAPTNQHLYQNFGKSSFELRKNTEQIIQTFVGNIQIETI